MADWLGRKTMTAEQERAAVVAWLRSVRGTQLGIKDRLTVAWIAIWHGETVYHGARYAAGNFIERGDHHK
jgi:hypothetical protein